MILLDTDHITLLEWGTEPGERIRSRLKLMGMVKTPPTTVVTYEEQIRGWMKEIAAARNVLEEVEIYSQLKIHLSFFSRLEVHDFSEKAATEFQRLRSLRVRIGTMDLKIAAIALSLGATLWSRNLKDFRKVPGLKVDDASA